VAGARLGGLIGIAIAILAHKIIQLTWSTSWVFVHIRRVEREAQLPSSTTKT